MEEGVKELEMVLSTILLVDKFGKKNGWNRLLARDVELMFYDREKKKKTLKK